MTLQDLKIMITTLTAKELEIKYGNLPKTEREVAMWHSGERAGSKSALKKARELIVEALGLYELFEPKHEHYDQERP